MLLALVKLEGKQNNKGKYEAEGEVKADEKSGKTTRACPKIPKYPLFEYSIRVYLIVTRNVYISFEIEVGDGKRVQNECFSNVEIMRLE